MDRNDMTLSERIIRGREAEYHLRDDFLNQVFDHVVETLMRDIIHAPIADRDAVMVAKSEINGLMLVRRRIKSLLDDGELAKAQQETESQQETMND